MVDHENTQLVLNAIASLRTELSQRMDRNDMERREQWKSISDLSNRTCPDSRHSDVEVRIRTLELDRAKMIGVVATVSVVASLIGWSIERLLK